MSCGIVLINLLAMTIVDFKKKKIAVWMLLIFVLCIVGIKIFEIIINKNDFDYLNIIYSFIFMLVLILISSISKCIGLADCLIVGFMCVAYNIYYGTIIFFIGMLAAAIFSVVGLACHRLGKKSTIPFIPFIFVANVFVVGMM